MGKRREERENGGRERGIESVKEEGGVEKEEAGQGQGHRQEGEEQSGGDNDETERETEGEEFYS